MWALEGLANFVPYAVVPLLVLMPTALVLRRRVLSLLAGGTLLVVLALTAAPTLLFLELPGDSPAGAAHLRVVTANVLMSNARLEDLANNVLAQDPDIVVFEELTRDLEEVAPALAAAYPYRLSTEAPWVTIASRLPLEETRRLGTDGEDRGRDLLSAAVEVNGQRLTLVAGHLMPPLNHDAFEVTRRQHEVLNKAIDEVTGPLLVVGDLNATSLSPTFAGFLWSTGLRIAAADRWPDSTYSVHGLGIRIDHVLVRDIGVSAERVFDLAGSDHRGVAVDVTLPSSENMGIAAHR
jgi:endonuclease/exonuclease/phosphatase (EEP) superfamily protein YafD